MESSSSNTVVNEGSNVTLHCNATGNPTPNITWRRNGILTVLHQGQNYIMNSINRNQAGNYFCSAWNGIGNKKNTTITVTVHCKLNLSSQLEDYLFLQVKIRTCVLNSN